jgi:hypothetical protein
MDLCKLGRELEAAFNGTGGNQDRQMQPRDRPYASWSTSSCNCDGHWPLQGILMVLRWLPHSFKVWPAHHPFPACSPGLRASLAGHSLSGGPAIDLPLAHCSNHCMGSVFPHRWVPVLPSGTLGALRHMRIPTVRLPSSGGKCNSSHGSALDPRDAIEGCYALLLQLLLMLTAPKP